MLVNEGKSHFDQKIKKKEWNIAEKRKMMEK